MIVEERVADEIVNRLRDRLTDRPAVTLHPAARSSAADLLERAKSDGAQDVLDHGDIGELRQNGTLRPMLLDRVRPDSEIAAADLFAPVISVIRVSDISQATELVNRCPYRLAASVFGPADQAKELGAQFDVGSVAINDLIVPTGDPRVPFGGRGAERVSA